MQPPLCHLSSPHVGCCGSCHAGRGHPLVSPGAEGSAAGRAALPPPHTRVPPATAQTNLSSMPFLCCSLRGLQGCPRSKGRLSVHQAGGRLFSPGAECRPPAVSQHLSKKLGYKMLLFLL